MKNKIHTYANLSQDEYLNQWVETNNELSKKGFTWGSLFENDEWHQYMSLDVLELSKKEVNEIQKATKDFSKLIQSVYKIVMNDPKYFAKLRLPVETWEATHVDEDDIFSYFCRFDIIKTNDGYKFIEINSDTPTGYLETSVANKVLCEKVGLKSPNFMEEAIQKAWERIRLKYDINDNETIYFTSYGWHEEDRKTVEFNMHNCNHPNVEYIDIANIYVAEDGLYTPEGKRIKYLYRLYPLEYLPYDEDANGKKIGNMFLDHVANERVKIINPPSAFVTQSKAFLAVMWDIYENHPQLLTKEELELIKKYVPRTYFSEEKFIQEGKKYVSKPVFGREGGGVSIIESDYSVETEDRTPEYYNQPKIYQEYIEMPELTISTWDGAYTGKLLIGSHLIGNEPCGIFLRVGEKITGNLSMFVGVGIKN